MTIEQLLLEVFRENLVDGKERATISAIASWVPGIDREVIQVWLDELVRRGEVKRDERDIGALLGRAPGQDVMATYELACVG